MSAQEVASATPPEPWRVLQELVDSHKDSLTDGLYTKLCEISKNMYDRHALHKRQLTVIYPVTRVKYNSDDDYDTSLCLGCNSITFNAILKECDCCDDTNRSCDWKLGVIGATGKPVQLHSQELILRMGDLAPLMATTLLHDNIIAMVTDDDELSHSINLPVDIRNVIVIASVI